MPEGPEDSDTEKNRPTGQQNTAQALMWFIRISKYARNSTMAHLLTYLLT